MIARWMDAVVIVQHVDERLGEALAVGDEQRAAGV